MNIIDFAPSSPKNVIILIYSRLWYSHWKTTQRLWKVGPFLCYSFSRDKQNTHNWGDRPPSPSTCILYVWYDSFSDVGESRVWFASKNLTPCRMHWNAFLISRKSTVWPWKLISSKKTPKNGLFQRPNIGITSLWEDLEAKLLTPGQLLGYPWKVWGITVQTSCVEGR